MGVVRLNADSDGEGDHDDCQPPGHTRPVRGFRARFVSRTALQVPASVRRTRPKTALSVIALGQVLKDDDTSSLPTPAKLLIVAIGAAMSGGLWIYDTRNNELYDELISRGRRIEAELGIHTGAYLVEEEVPGFTWRCCRLAS